MQYYEFVSSICVLVAWIQEQICPKAVEACEEVARIGTADSVDIDYDTVSQSLTFSVYHAQAVSMELGKMGGIWHEKITERAGLVTTEVGILNEETATEPEELSLGGFLVTLGRDKKPSKHHDSLNGLRLTIQNPHYFPFRPVIAIRFRKAP